MVNMLLFTVIISLLFTIIIIPFSLPKKTRKKETKPLNLKWLLFTFVFVFIVVFAVYYFTNLDLRLSSLWFFFIVVALIGSFFAQGMERKIKGGLFLISIVSGVIFVTAFLFNANEKYDTSKMTEKTEIEIFDETETPASVPPEFARNKMKKAFGQVPNTSYYELGNLQIQKVNNEYVYIAPVEFSGLFKWLKGDETPGYFTISATDSSANPKFVEANMLYTPSSYFDKNIERHLRLQFPKFIFYGDAQLEIDDDGNPYYIRTYGNFISARNGFEVKGIVVVNPKDGDTKVYATKEAPSFIDGSVSPEAVSLKNSYYGNYVHGFWNSVFGKSDVKLPSDEGTEANVSPIFSENGEMYYFTDFTSPKKGVDSMLGYSLTNARTGEAIFYTGNREQSYMDSEAALQIIEKKFIEKKWNGAMPILYNFYGEASWLAGVLDANGFLQNYFIVSAANPEISAYANTPNEALKLYKTALQRGGGTVDGSSKAEEKQTSGKIIRLYKEKTDQWTTVSFLLNTKQNFVVTSETSPMAIYLKEGDTVNIRYLETGEQFLPVKELTIKGLD